MVAITKPSDHHSVHTLDLSGSRSFTLPWDASVYDTMFWIKARDAADSWYQVDTLRGLTKYLQSNGTGAEGTFAGSGVTVSGTTVTLADTTAFPSDANDLYVVQAWKAGLQSARATNTAGSITSTVSANTTAGFSIVTYTGTGANATVGHGLGVAPKMVIVKNRSTAATDWVVGHSSLTSWAYVLYLDLTAAQSNSTTQFNSTAPTSTVFSVGTATATNENTKNLVAYCFAEIPGFSKFGSYTSNNSSDGTYVHLGFRARWLMIKCSSNTGYHWIIIDTARDTYNVSIYKLGASSANEENNAVLGNTTESLVDITAFGFKMKSANGINSPSGYTFIYAAFAEFPNGSNVAPAPAR